MKPSIKESAKVMWAELPETIIMDIDIKDKH